VEGNNMSGGRFDYFYSKLNELLADIEYDYDLNKKIKLSTEERILKRLLTDLSSLLHDYEWWKSGDIDEKDFIKSFNKFKRKWLK
jgi:hypothetical protein